MDNQNINAKYFSDYRGYKPVSINAVISEKKYIGDFRKDQGNIF